MTSSDAAQGRRYYSGIVESISDTVGLRGVERFSVSVAPDGSRTLHATCEIFDRSVSKDVVYSVDKDFNPIDSYVRLIKNGSLLGTGWFRFDGSDGEVQAWNRDLGRVEQRITLDAPIETFGPHPLSCDCWHLAAYDHQSGEKMQPMGRSFLSSLEHDGCSGPMLHPIAFGIEYVGRTTITVRAGTFEVDHYLFRLEGSLPVEHPTEELWVMPDDFIIVKIRVGGYLATTYELVEFNQ
ncbi:hypothetical protein [Sphingobium chungbukense]|uniref:DUF3108 domain-containing protein n=1 Tax=Sphingobium chungbukense TaxID=56193 RepID=A0A0M3AS44_9SPHN|nr:hypothetical protein [Sphingobium chungbukense]KKW91731.1 hypothetical protein YP76_11380 [Sphingobium chungbukense]